MDQPSIFGKDIVTLTDEFGRDIDFEIYGTVEMDGTVYVGLLEIFDDPQKQFEKEPDLFILKTVEDAGGEEILVTFEDEDELNRVVELFEEEYDDVILR